MKKLTLEDLKQIREEHRQSLDVRKGGQKDKVVVHMGTCGIAAGARDVMSAILAELAQEGAPDVIVSQSSCIGLCDREPIVTVIRAGEEPIRYFRMDAEKIKRVLREHVAEGKIVGEYTR